MTLSFWRVRNSELSSNHWLEHRLVLEPEWTAYTSTLEPVLDTMMKLWKVQRTRVEHYGTEQALEEAFIQPVPHALGWELNYRTFLRSRKPDYTLFLDNEAYDAALHAGIKTPSTGTSPPCPPTARLRTSPWIARALLMPGGNTHPPVPDVYGQRRQECGESRHGRFARRQV